MRTGKIHYAKLATSARLQRLHALLLSGKAYTTLEISKLANIAAVSAATTELRRNGIKIDCRLTSRNTLEDSRTFTYQMAA